MPDRALAFLSMTGECLGIDKPVCVNFWLERRCQTIDAFREAESPTIVKPCLSRISRGCSSFVSMSGESAAIKRLDKNSPFLMFPFEYFSDFIQPDSEVSLPWSLLHCRLFEDPLFNSNVG